MSFERTFLLRMIDFVSKLIALPLMILLISAALVWLFCGLFLRITLLLIIWLTWSTRDISLLVVYSNSPHWQSYFEQGLLPLIRHKSKTLNWSNRSAWNLNLKTLAFHQFAGEKEFNPIIIFFRPFHWPKSLRFYQPFRDARHGKTEPLRKLEIELSSVINQQINLENFYLRKSV